MKKQEIKASVGFPGYFDIDGFSNYGVTRKGVVINKVSGEYLQGSRNPAGYLNFRLTNDVGKTHTLGRHRLLGLVFKHPGVDVTNLIVNHENGIKGDDWLDNLEWMSHQGNMQHAGAMGLTSKCLPISVRDADTGEVQNFPSIVACARVMGVSKDFVNYRVKSDGKQIFPERKQYRQAKVEDPWYIPIDVERDLLLNGTAKSVLVRDVFTGGVTRFNQLTELASHLGIALPTMSMWLTRPNQPVLPGFVQVKLASDVSPWREVIDPYLDLESSSGCRVVKVTNAATGASTLFTSAKECADVMHLSPTALNYRLSSKRARPYPDGNHYCYYVDSLTKNSGPFKL